MSESAKNSIAWIVIWTVIIGLVVGFIAGIGQIVPRYNVWSREMAGKAKLAEAKWDRQVAVTEAEAKQHAATALAGAEIERAKGVAEANRIIGDSLRGNDDYLRWLWIDKLEAGTGRETIYVPTEANIPIMESGRFRRQDMGTGTPSGH